MAPIPRARLAARHLNAGRGVRRRTWLASTGALVLGSPAASAALDALERLKPNQAVQLGTAAVTGELNDVARHFGLHRRGPQARDFCIKMVWAPERRTALFTGANHGSPHRLNDVWEFDLAALAWRCLYAPDLPRSYGGLGEDASDVIFRDGVLMTRRGGPAVMGHTWSGLTYDPDRRVMLFMNTWPVKIEPLVQQVGGDPARRDPGPPLWSFDPAGGRWQPVKTAAPWPKAAVGALLQHVPELGGSLWHLNNWQLSATWLFDGRRWRVIADEKRTPGFGRHAPGRELVGYHDAKRQRLVAQWQTGTYHFDTVQRRWAVALPPDDSQPEGHDAYTAWQFDPRRGRGMLYDMRSGALWAYEPEPPRWQRLEPAGPAAPRGNRVLAYMDPARDVFVVIDDLGVWAYRPE